MINNMKPTAVALLAGVMTFLLSGCARNTVEHRKQERYGAYAALPEDTRLLVDTGQIKIGMPMDAVYIAWGKPSQVLSRESSEGLTTVWVYHNTHLEPTYYWTYRYYNHGRYCYPEPYWAHDYYVRSYVSAEVHFEKGQVKEWRTLPYPTDY